jgi:hypothetical protein
VEETFEVTLELVSLSLTFLKGMLAIAWTTFIDFSSEGPLWLLGEEIILNSVLNVRH